MLHHRHTRQRLPPGVVTARVAFAKNVEPPREELFLAGTEPLSRRQGNTVYEEAHIVYPQEGTLITVDPDIPASLQRVGLRFEPRGKRFRWMINGSRCRFGRPASPLGAEARHIYGVDRGPGGQGNGFCRFHCQIKS